MHSKLNLDQKIPLSTGNEWLLVNQTLFVVCSEKAALYLSWSVSVSNRIVLSSWTLYFVKDQIKKKNPTQNQHRWLNQCSCVVKQNYVVMVQNVYTFCEPHPLYYLFMLSWVKGNYFKIKKKTMYTLQL